MLQIDSMFNSYNKELNFVRIKAALFHGKARESGAFPILTNTKKAIWRHLWSIQNEAIPLVAMCWQRIVIGLGKSRHCQTRLECRFSWNENLQRRKNWTSKSTILKENAGKVKSVFVIRSAQWAEKLGCCLEYCRSRKLRSENLQLRSTWRPFDSSFERKVSDGGNLCSLWSVILKSVLNIVSETPFSCDTVGRELLWALHAAVLWNGLEHSPRKARLCVYFIWFYEVVFWCFAFLTTICVSRISCDWEKLNLLNELIS